MDTIRKVRWTRLEFEEWYGLNVYRIYVNGDARFKLTDLYTEDLTVMPRIKLDIFMEEFEGATILHAKNRQVEFRSRAVKIVLERLMNLYRTDKAKFNSLRSDLMWWARDGESDAFILFKVINY